MVLTVVLVILIYAAAVITVYRRLIPGLPSEFARLPLLLLVAQALVFIGHFLVPQSWTFVYWLFHPDKELNIPSLLSSTQLALVSGAALAIAWLHSSRPPRQRLYFFALGLLFLFLAWEEYTEAFKFGAFAFSSSISWHTFSWTIGIVFAALTAWAALRSSRSARSWHLCFLAGFALVGVAGIVIDDVQLDCAGSIFAGADGCLKRYILDESMEFLGAWLALVGLLGHFTALRPPLSLWLRRLLQLLPLFWVAALIHRPVFLTLEGRFSAQPASVQFESSTLKHGIHLNGYRIERNDGAVALELITYAKRNAHFDRGFSAHLVDQVSAKSVASGDKFWAPEAGAKFGPGSLRAYRSRIEMEIPPESATNRALWLALTLWERLELDRFWGPRLPPSRQGTRWLDVLKTLVCYQLIDPGSEWRLHRHWYQHSAMADLLGSPVAVVGALLWIRRDMRHDIAELRRDLTAQIAAVNTRIDNILLADRKTP